LLTFFIILAGLVSFGQYDSKYFVYLQTEPAQPFYIRINQQTISANTSGYLILPQLKDGNYKLVVGFPQNKYPELTFNFRIDSKDKGYLIKNFGDEGWGLFDLQSMAVEKPIPAGAADHAVAPAPVQKQEPVRKEPETVVKEQAPVQKQVEVRKEPEMVVTAQTPVQTQEPVKKEPETVMKENVSDFTKVLSKAANDPGLLEKPKEEPPKVVSQPQPVTTPVQETTLPESRNKEAVVVEEKPVVHAGAPDAAKSAQAQIPPTAAKSNESEQLPKVIPAKESAIQKVTQAESEAGLTAVYEDRTEKGKTDAVTIFIPSESNVQHPKPVSEQPVAVQAPAVVPEKPAAKTTEPPIENKKQAEEEKPLNPVQAEKGTEEVTAGNSNPGGTCKSVADDNDFIRLRRLMAQRDTDDEMISEARRAFRNKCYTTAHIKYLSSMFLSNSGKYNFYQAAFPHVSDPANFTSLRSEIKDNYYLGKFDALTGR